MSDSLETNKIKFLDLTHKLNDYNEIYSVNNYLKSSYTSEVERLDSTNKNLLSRILRMKQQYMLYDSGVEEYRFRTNVMYFTAFIAAIVLVAAAMFVQGRIPPLTALIITLVLIVIYFIIVLIMVRSNIERRKYSYHQYYWDPVYKKK